MIECALDTRHPRRSDHDTFSGQRVGDHLPAVVHGTDHVFRRHPNVVVELGAERLSVERKARPDAHARRAQIGHQHADAGVLFRIGIGAHRKPDIFGLVAAGGPQLLAIDDPVVAVADRAGAQRREIGAGLRLAVP